MFKQITLAALALLALTATTRADDDDDMLDEVAIYASINAIALPCHIEAVDQAANKATLKLVQSNAEAKQIMLSARNTALANYAASQEKALFCANVVKFSDGHAKFAK